MFQSASLPVTRKAAIFGLICLFCLAIFLAFLPQASFGYFHEQNNSGGRKNVAGTTTARPSPKPKGTSFKFSLAPILGFLGLDDVKLSAAPKPTVKPKTTAAAPKVKGAQDKKAGESAIAKFFKGIGNVLAAIGDALWPFDGKDKGLAKDRAGTAGKSPVLSPSPEPKELAQTGELEVTTASDSSVVSVIDTVDDLTVKGKLTVGDSGSDRIKFVGLMESDILVDTTKKYDIGSGSGRFRSGYFSDNLYVGEENRIGATGMNVKGSAYIETRSGGSIYLLPDSQNVYIGTDDKTGHLTVANNLTVKGTLSTTSGASLTPDSIDITPATNIDALDITGTNITTASLIDLDPTGTTSGNIIDIDTSTAHTGHVISVDNTGNAVWTGNIIDVTTGTGDASGDILKMTFEAGATDVQGIVLANAAASDQAGWFVNVDTTGIFSASMFQFDSSGNVAWTGNLFDVDTGTGNYSGDVINVLFEASTNNDGQFLVLVNDDESDQAGWLANVNATAAFTSSMFQFDSTTNDAWTGNLFDIDTGTGNVSGDVMNVNFEATTNNDAQFLVLVAADELDQAGWLANVDIQAAATAAMFFVDSSNNSAWTGNLLDVDTGTGNVSGNVIDVNFEATTNNDAQFLVLANADESDQAGWLMDIDTSAAWTANMIDITTGAQVWTANILDVNVGAANASGDVINITMDDAAVATQALVIDTAAGIQTASPVYLNWDNTTGTVAAIDIDVAGTRGGVLDIDIEAALGTEAVIAIDVADTVAATSDMIAIQLNDSLASGAFVVLGADGARTDAIIDITTASTGSAADAAAIMQINSTGDLDDLANVLDINMSGGTGANVIDITTLTNASSGNLIDLNFGAILDTGDAINIALGGTAVGAQALVATNTASTRTASMIQVDDNNNTGTVATFDLNIASTRGGLMDIDATGAFGTENMIDVLANAAFTSSVLDISATGSVLTGDLVSLDYTRTHVATATVDTATALAITRDLDIDDSTGGAVTLTVSAPLVTITEAVCTPGAADVCTFSGNLLQVDANTISSGNLVDLNLGAIAHTGDAINIALGASAPAAQALVVSSTSSTATAGVIDLNVDTAAAQSATVVDITSTVGIMDGSDTFKGINIAITGANHTGASNVIRGLDVSLTTPDADAAEIGINVGDNWDLGISSTSGIGIGAQKTLTADSTTPSVAGTSHAITANTVATLYSNFTGGTSGQLLVIEVNDANSTFDCIGSEATINCGGIDIAAAAGDILTWVYDGTIWNLVNWLDESDAQTGADLAEYFGSHETLEPGDVVIADVNNPEYVIKSSQAYDGRLLGVVSTMPGLVIGDPNDLNQIALTGRVPVKVTNENGAIAAGDYLTSSSTSGYAMKATKAGPVVGMALESFDGDKGTVVVFVKATWYDPIEEQKRAVLAALGLGSSSVLGASTSATDGSVDGATATATSPLIGAAPDGSLGVLAEEVDLLVHGLLTANNLRVTTAAEFEGTLVVKGLATFEGDLVVKGAFSTGSLDLSGALTKTMTAASDLSAGDPVVVTGANTVARAGSSSANVVGLAASSAGAGSSVRVAVAGTVGGYSGLATGARYYVGSGGVVTTAPGGDRAVHIGIAISGSEMIVQIFESTAPPAPLVVDTATVDTGPTVTVSDGTSSGSTSGGSSETSSSPTPETSPAPTPEPSPSPAGEPSPEPTVVPESSPAPSPEPTPSPQP